MAAQVREHQDDPHLAFLPPHVVDLANDGHIGAHVDSIKFSGGIVAGLSLLSQRTMRLEYDHEAHAALPAALAAVHLYSDATVTVSAPGENSKPPLATAVEFVLPPRSLYVMAGPLRYFFSHQVLGKGSPAGLPSLLPPDESSDSLFERRISVVLRDIHEM
jgi:alkylated DNA repair protein alkB family protein 7